MRRYGAKRRGSYGRPRRSTRRSFNRGRSRKRGRRGMRSPRPGKIGFRL